jgi:hypothetical protein
VTSRRSVLRYVQALHQSLRTADLVASPLSDRPFLLMMIVAEKIAWEIPGDFWRSPRPPPALRFEQARDRGVDVVAIVRLLVGKLLRQDELRDQARDRVAGEPQLDAVQVLFLAGELLALALAIGGAAQRDRSFASGFIGRREHPFEMHRARRDRKRAAKGLKWSRRRIKGAQFFQVQAKL